MLAVVMAASLAVLPSLDLDAPQSSLGIEADEWSSKLRGGVGRVVRLRGDVDESGFVAELPVLVELRNAYESGPTPFQFWRGRLALGLGWRALQSDGALSRSREVQLLLEHESAHATETFFSSGGGEQGENGVALRGSWGRSSAGLQWTLRGTLHLHLASCTDDREHCSGWGGSSAVGGDLGATVVAHSWKVGPLLPYASGFLDYTHPQGRVMRESRVLAALGLILPTKRSWVALQASVFLGNDTGLLREDESYRLRVGLIAEP